MRAQQTGIPGQGWKNVTSHPFQASKVSFHCLFLTSPLNSPEMPLYIIVKQPTQALLIIRHLDRPPTHRVTHDCHQSAKWRACNAQPKS